MKLLISTSVALAVALCFLSAQAAVVDKHDHTKVVCFWNSTSFLRTGPAKFQVDDLKPALGTCTHLIYGFAGIRAGNHEVISLNPSIDTGAGYAFYRHVTQLKRQFPDLKVYLGIGGNADPEQEDHKYLTLTESSESRTRFINSVLRILADYEFDGVDLAWQFPAEYVKKDHNIFVSFWHGVKSRVGAGKFHDKNVQEHRDGFSILVRDLKSQLQSKNKALTISVLPHTNSSLYYDARVLSPHVDAVHLLAFDQKTPDRNPEEADRPAPIYASYGRVPDDNIEYQVRYWLENGTPGTKIVVAIPTFGRTWKLNDDSEVAGVPPVTADGPGMGGPLTNWPGYLSYPEVCALLTESTLGRLRLVNDVQQKYGPYAFQPYNKKTGADGVWVGFDSTDYAGAKAQYVKTMGLGGVAIYELSLDDFRGSCNGDKFPITKAAKFKL